MNRNWIKRIVAIVVFLISIFVIDFVMNRETSEITMDMPKATLPVVSVEVEEYKINTMYGYTSKREESSRPIRKTQNTSESTCGSSSSRCFL